MESRLALEYPSRALTQLSCASRMGNRSRVMSRARMASVMEEEDEEELLVLNYYQ